MTNDLMTTNDDGFDAAVSDRVIQGELLKCKDGRWACGTESVGGEEMFLVVGTAECVQRWADEKPIETIATRPLPDVDTLNASVPATEWEQGLNGPRPPWQHQRAVYFVKPTSGATYTYITGTIGGRMAIQALASSVANMRKLRGENVLPVVCLGSKTMKTKFGQRIRPEFVVKDWRRQPTSPPAIEAPVKAPTAAEELNDRIPW